MPRGAGKIIVGVGLLVLGLYQRFANDNTDGGTFWPIVGLTLIGWGTLELSRAGRHPGLSIGPNALASTLKLAQADGAPAPPWPPESGDTAFAFRLAALLSEAGPELLIQECPGPFGPRLELVLKDDPNTVDPIFILSRNWDPDDKTMKTMIMFSGTVSGKLERVVEDEGFKRLGPREGPFPVFHR